MRAFGKSAVRLFRKHIVRLITVVAIVMVSIGVMSGIGELENRIKVAAERYYRSANISDLYIKCTRTAPLPDGSVVSAFTSQEKEAVTQKFGAQNVQFGFCYETEQNGALYRVYTFDFADTTVNKPQLLEGSYPSASNEILVEHATEQLQEHHAGDTVTLNGNAYTVSGIILHPLYLYELEEPSFLDADRPLDCVVYFHVDDLPMANDAFVALADRNLFDSFGKKYKKEITALQTDVQTLLGDNATVLTLYENIGLYSLISYAEKVGLIGIVFVVFFLLVTMLVVYSNMSRLYDEERAQMACLKTLGYSNFAVIARYSLFVLVGTIAGSLLALPIGLGLTAILYSAFNMQYAMPPFPGIVNMGYYAMTVGIIIVSMLLLTFFTGLKIVRHKPVTLLTPKAPKSGKKVIIERIGFIWKRLSFKYKSTLRNVLLFKSRFFMTVISIIGSTVLILAGFGLMDCTLKMGAAASILGIAAALIIFSAVLCALVIYNLTNINVSERNREIATLMVLGYHDKEVTGYIFREIYIMCLLGALLGIPAGLGFLTFVFRLIDFGAIADINWWTWILAPAVTMLFAFLSTLMLRGKITKTDMNASLKTLE